MRLVPFSLSLDEESSSLSSSSQLYGQQGLVAVPQVTPAQSSSVVEAEAVFEDETVVEVVEVVAVMVVAEEEDEEADEDDSYPLSTPPQRVDRQVVVRPPRPEPPRPPNNP